MKPIIAGTGVATPRHAIEQTDAAQLAATINCQTAVQQRILPSLYRRTGVGRRYSVLLDDGSNGCPAEQSFYWPATSPTDAGPTTHQRMEAYESHAAPLACAASRRALTDASLAAREITHLITVSCSGFNAPGFDVALIDELGLPLGTPRTHVGFMGCHGALNGLRVAKAFIDADPTARVLLCAVELCSLHHQYGWDSDTLVANALFADGAAALVCQAESSGASTDEVVHRSGRSPDHTAAAESAGGSHRQRPAWRLLDTGSTLVPDSTDAMAWRIRDHGFEMVLSPHVPQLIEANLGRWLRGWLEPHGHAIDAIGSWAIHPGGPRILDACAAAAGLTPEQLAPSRGVLRDFGNMSSPTVLFILQRLRHQQAALPCVLLGFGPGLAIEATLLG